MTNNYKYNFSYTGFSLRLAETIKVAIARIENADLDAVLEIGGGKTATTKKFLNEINKRLSQLNTIQLDLLIDGDLTTQKQIAFLAVCKAHYFIRDFVVEVIREKTLLFDYNLSEGDYITFFRNKTELHPEMDNYTENTIQKIRNVSFRILEEAGIIDDVKNKAIQPQLMDQKTRTAIATDNPNYLKLFLMSDLDILNLTKN